MWVNNETGQLDNYLILIAILLGSRCLTIGVYDADSADAPFAEFGEQEACP